jgi:hypothetical protein
MFGSAASGETTCAPARIRLIEAQITIAAMKQ